jgi:hypothetical protein
MKTWMMRKFILVTLAITGSLVIINAGCEEKEEEKQPDRYSFWKGDITNFYYCLDMNNNLTHKVSGKPFMVLEYDPVTNVPLRCEFGLSEAKNEYLPGAEGAIPIPFIFASSLEYAVRLNLTGSVDLLCNWESIVSNEALSDGGYEFYTSQAYGPTLYFSYTPNGMDGEIINPEPSWGDRVSDLKAFKLLRKFNSNTIGN